MTDSQFPHEKPQRAQRAGSLLHLHVHENMCPLSPFLDETQYQEWERTCSNRSFPNKLFADKLCPLLNPVKSPDSRTLCRSTRCTGTSSTTYLQKSGKRNTEKGTEKKRIWKQNRELRKEVLHLPPPQSRVSARKVLLLLPGTVPSSKWTPPLVSRPGFDRQDKHWP